MVSISVENWYETFTTPRNGISDEFFSHFHLASMVIMPIILIWNFTHYVYVGAIYFIALSNILGMLVTYFVLFIRHCMYQCTENNFVGSFSEDDRDVLDTHC